MKNRSKKLSPEYQKYSFKSLEKFNFVTVFKFVIPLAPITKKNSNEIVRSKAKKDDNGKIIKPSQMRIVASPAFRKYEKDVFPFIPRNLNIAVPINLKAIYYLDGTKYSDLNNYHNALHDVLVDYHVIADDNHYIVTSTDGSKVLIDRNFPRTEVYIQIRK